MSGLMGGRLGSRDEKKLPPTCGVGAGWDVGGVHTGDGLAGVECTRIAVALRTQKAVAVLLAVAVVKAARAFRTQICAFKARRHVSHLIDPWASSSRPAAAVAALDAPVTAHGRVLQGVLHVGLLACVS